MALNQSVKDMLNRLKDKVYRILNGSEVLLEEESFAVAVTRFMKLKETYITKVSLPNGDYELKYDLDKGRTILKDLLFLYFCVTMRMERSTGVLDPTFAAALKNHQSTKCYDDAGNQITKNTCLISGSGVAKLKNKHAVAALDDAAVLDIVRDAVVVMDMIRNSFGHNDEGKKCSFIESSKTIKILNNGGFDVFDSETLNSIKNYLDIELPLEYISEFGEGIEARNEDSLAMEFADLNASLIASSLRHSSGVFKRVKVERLRYLYNVVGNDNSLLHDLPKMVFSSAVTQSKLEYLFSKCDLEDFKRLPVGVFASRCTPERILRIHNLGLDSGDFYGPNRPLEKLNIDLLSSLPDLIFTCSDYNFKLIENLTNPLLHSENKLIKPLDLNKVPRGIFYASTSQNRIDYFIKNCKTLDEFYKLPVKSFSNRFSNEKLVYIVGTDNPDLTRLYDLPDIVFSEDSFIDKIEFFMGPNKDVSILKDIPEELFDFRFTVEKLKILLGDGDISDLKNVDFSFLKRDSDIERVASLVGTTLNINLLKRIPSKIFDASVSDSLAKELLSFMDDSDIYRKVIKTICFDTFSFDNFKFIFNLDSSLTDNQVLHLLFENDDLKNAVIHIPMFAFSSRCSINRLAKFIGDNKDYTRLYNLCPLLFSSTVRDDRIDFLLKSSYAMSFFTNPNNRLMIRYLVFSSTSINRIKLLCGEDLKYDLLHSIPDYVCNGSYSDKKLEFLLEKFGHVSALRFIPPICFSGDASLAKIKFLYDISGSMGTFCNLAPYLFDRKCPIERIHMLLSLVNNEVKQLNELPKELFYCDESMVKTLFEMNKKNMKVRKDLFSHLNNDSLALVIYMNALFSVYDKNDVKYALLDFRCLDTLTQDSYFEGKTHVDIINNINHLCSLCSSKEKFDKIVDSNRLSFTRQWNQNEIRNMSAEQLLIHYKKWESDFRGFFNDWMLKKLSDCSRRTTDNVRNASDHLRFMQLSDGVLGLYDEEVKKKRNGNIENAVSFSARSGVKDLFNAVSLIHSQVVDGDYTQHNNFDSCLKYYVDSLGANLDYWSLKNNLFTWIEEYIDTTRKMCVSLYYLKNSPFVSNATATYANNDGYRLLYNHTGANVCKPVSVWYCDLDEEIINNDISVIDTKFKR